MASNMSDDSSDDGSDMSVNSARSNHHPFETLSDDPILHILSFLPGGDLLTLAGMDKKFNRIVKTTQETMAKIRLVVIPEKSVEFDEVIQFAQAHQITALKLIGLRLNNVSFELFELLHVLSNTVEDLVIEKCCFTNQYQFRMIIQKFLGRMTKCGIYDSRIQYDDNVISWQRQSSIDYPLKALSIECDYHDDYHNTEFIKFFEGCTQLQSFKTDIPRNYVEPKDQEKDQDRLPKFLARQTHLKKLTFDPSDYDLHLMSFPQLEELTLSDTKQDTDWEANAIQVSPFLTKLPNLKTLYLQVDHELSPLIMEAVCNAPKLEDLRIQVTCKDEFVYELDYPDNEGRFQNQTVKKLRIEDERGFVHWLLQMFLGVDSVILDVPKLILNLSEVPYDVLEKIEFEDSSSRLNVEFAPHELPINMESFESAVLSFASKHAERIVGIQIGAEYWPEWWSESLKQTPAEREFSLSTSFCERLIKCLPKLEKLELHNVADFHGVESFLKVHKKNFPKLKGTMLYPSYLESDVLLDLSSVHHNVIEKMKFEGSSSRLNVKFTPYELLATINMESFEPAVLSFASKHAGRIVGIQIAAEYHSVWCSKKFEADFSLSTSFCERLIKCLPKLEKLELYNVADFHGVESFLVVYKKKFPKLKYTMLHSTDPELDGDSSINTDDPEPEKMEMN